jgi:hypothetical protein
MDLWTLLIVVCAVAVIVYLMHRLLPESQWKPIAIWIVIAFVALWLASKWLAPILKGIRL